MLGDETWIVLSPATMLSCMNDVALVSYAAVTMRHHPSKGHTNTCCLELASATPGLCDLTSDGRFRLPFAFRPDSRIQVCVILIATRRALG